MQFVDKGAKAPEVPVRHDLDEWIAADIEQPGLADAPKAFPLSRAGQRRYSTLTEWALSPLAVEQMLKCRVADQNIIHSRA